MDIIGYYRLEEDPFKLTPDTAYFYPSRSHETALKSMDYVVEQKEGFCLITGKPGTGKTTVLNVFMRNWKTKAEIALILASRLGPEEFLRVMLGDLGIVNNNTGKVQMLKALRDFLIEKSEKGRAVAVVVDEA